MSKFVKKLKGIAPLAIAVLVFASTATPVFARVSQETIVVNFNNIRIAVNGQQINTEFEPFIFQGVTYLPVRDVAIAMGFAATWENATSTVHLTSQANVPQQTVAAPGRVAQESIVVNFNNIRFAVNGTHVNTEFDPFIFQGRTYLPVRDVANAMGFDVTWEGATNTVHLTSRTGNVMPNYPAHQQTPQAPAQAGGITIGNVVPRAPARAGGPANPAISAQRAVELARDHLVANGVASARFDYVYMDIENGVWVWSVEFDGQGRSFEFYVNVNTGAFVRAPIGLGGGTAAPAAPAPAPAPAQQQPAGAIPPGVNRANFQRNVSRWGHPPSNPTRGTWWGSSYVWDGHRWNSSLS